MSALLVLGPLALALLALAGCTSEGSAQPPAAGSSARPAAAASASAASSRPVVPDPAHADPVLEFFETDPAWIRAALGAEYRKAHCAYDRYGESPGKLYTVAHCSAGGEGSTASVLPAALSVTGTVVTLSITSFERPGDGSQNGVDMRRIFPKSVMDATYRKMGSDRELSRRADKRAVDAQR